MILITHWAVAVGTDPGTVHFKDAPPRISGDTVEGKDFGAFLTKEGLP
jgi:hypothetical protein